MKHTTQSRDAQDADDGAPVVLAIAGYGRSGSTLLQGLLAERLGGCALGEVKYLFSRGFIRGEKCSCGEPAPNCAFWAPVAARTLEATGETLESVEALRRRVERNRHYLLHVVLRLPSARYARDRRRYVEIIERLLSEAARESGRGYVIDSSKDVGHLELLASTATLRPHVIQLIRDSRAVAFSQKTPKRKTEVWWKEEFMGARGIVSSTAYWVYLNALSARLADRGPYLKVRYEDLMSDPDAVLDGVAEWVDAPPEPAAAPISHAVSGNPGRFDKSATRLKPDNRWRTGMSTREFLIVTALSAPLLKRFGYKIFSRSNDR